jgi:hypothetical protein
MKPILFYGTTIVNLALISYSIFFYLERKYKLITPKLLIFLTLGVILDITATSCMIIGSSKSPFTLHGMLGYSALVALLIDAIIIWWRKKAFGLNTQISKKLHVYSLVAYIWWIAAYVTGALIVFLRHHRA